MKRLVVISDTHCGHQLGLTHPNYDVEPSKNSTEYELFKLRRKYYSLYKATIESLKPIDILLVNGDTIDGRGEKSGGTELLRSDRNVQVAMAAAIINDCQADKIVMSYGTPYHTGDAEDYEDQLADKVKALEINGHGFLDIDGLIIDYKHKVGSSSVPYGRYTQIAKEKVWNSLWAEFDEVPNSDVTIRSHVHYFGYAGRYGWLGVTTPALQGHGTKYGERQMSGTTDWGLIHFDIEAKGEYTWTHHIFKPKKSRVVATKL